MKKLIATTFVAVIALASMADSAHAGGFGGWVGQAGRKAKNHLADRNPYSPHNVKRRKEGLARGRTSRLSGTQRPSRPAKAGGRVSVNKQIGAYERMRARQRQRARRAAAQEAAANKAARRADERRRAQEQAYARAMRARAAQAASQRRTYQDLARRLRARVGLPRGGLLGGR